jgi:hypothetical protein
MFGRTQTIGQRCANLSGSCAQPASLVNSSDRIKTKGVANMTAKTLKVKHCRTHDGKPLATVDGLPGDMAHLSPAQLRALATAMLKIASDCEARPMGPRTYREHRAEYTVAV